jgi:Fic family protein
MQEDIEGSSNDSRKQSPTTFFFLVAKEMEDFFGMKLINQPTSDSLAAEMHERLVTISFIDGNGRTSRLVMNLVLLQHGYIIAIYKGDYESRMRYYQTLEPHKQKLQRRFLLFIAQIEKKV